MTAVWMVKDGPYFSLLSARLSWFVDHRATNGTSNQRLFGLERSSEVALIIGSLLPLGYIATMVGSPKFQGDTLGFEIPSSAANLLCNLRSQLPVSLSMS